MFLQKDPERRTDLSDKDQPSILPPVRNPFKLTNKQDKTQSRADPDTELHKGKDKRDNTHVNIEDHENTENEGGNAKTKTETEKSIEGQGGSNGEGGNAAVSDSWRNKKLPAGMKIRKRVSDDEREPTEDTKCPESPNSVEESTGVHKLVEKASESCSLKDQQEQKPTATASSSLSASKSSRGPDKKTAVENEAENDVIPNKQSSDKTQSRSQTTPSSALQDLPENLTCNGQRTEPNHSKDKGHKGVVSSQFGEWSDDDDDDDVQVVSVHPAPQQSARTPPAPVQKTLTAYPGFQPASKVKGQSEDPVALHSHLTAQLKQKKVTLLLHYQIQQICPVFLICILVFLRLLCQW